MSRKISIILFVLFVLGIILGGFLILKNNNHSLNENIPAKNIESPTTLIPPTPVAGGPGQAVSP